MSKARLLVAVVMGLGQKASGKLLGLREMLSDPTIAGTFDLLTAEHNNKAQLQVIREAIPEYDHVILVGHSLGGAAAYGIAKNQRPAAARSCPP